MTKRAHPKAGPKPNAENEAYYRAGERNTYARQFGAPQTPLEQPGVFPFIEQCPPEQDVASTLLPVS